MKRRRTAGACVALLLLSSATASAQLDPLLFAKRVPPTVIIIVDTSLRMMEDGNGNYYDPNDYITSNDPVVAMQLGVSGSNRYRRIYRNLQYENIQDSSTKFMATDITAVPDSSAAYAPFFNNTRLQMAKQAIDAAVSENAGSSFRWGLIKLRQTNPSWRISPNCDKPVRITGNASLAMVSDANPCNVGGAGKYGIYTPNPGGAANYTIEALNGG